MTGRNSRAKSRNLETWQASCASFWSASVSKVLLFRKARKFCTWWHRYAVWHKRLSRNIESCWSCAFCNQMLELVFGRTNYMVKYRSLLHSTFALQSSPEQVSHSRQIMKVVRLLRRAAVGSCPIRLGSWECLKVSRFTLLWHTQTNDFSYRPKLLSLWVRLCELFGQTRKKHHNESNIYPPLSYKCRTASTVKPISHSWDRSNSQSWD